MVSVAEDNISDFEKFIENIPYEKIGAVTNCEIEIDGENWENIFYWKSKYENAIETYFKNYQLE